MPILNLLKNMRRLRKAEELSVEQVRSLRESSPAEIEVLSEILRGAWNNVREVEPSDAPGSANHQ
jgi:hypothetical protein